MRSLPIVAAIAVLSLPLGCRKPGPSGIEVPERIANYVPSDAVALAGMNLEKLKSTALYRKHESQLNLPLLNAAAERLGLDPRRDITQSLICWRGDRVFAIFTGPFSGVDLKPKLLAAGALNSNYRGRQLLGLGGQALFFPTKDVLIVGETAAVHSEIDSGANGRVPPGISDQLHRLPAADQIWAVTTQPLALSLLPMRSEVSSALANITGVITDGTLGIGADSGLHVHADLNCVSEDGARRVHDALRGIIGLARLTTKDDQLDMLRVYDSIRVEQDHVSVRIHSDLDGELTDRLFTYLQRRGE